MLSRAVTVIIPAGRAVLLIFRRTLLVGRVLAFLGSALGRRRRRGGRGRGYDGLPRDAGEHADLALAHAVVELIDAEGQGIQLAAEHGGAVEAAEAVEPALGEGEDDRAGGRDREGLGGRVRDVFPRTT